MRITDLMKSVQRKIPKSETEKTNPCAANQKTDKNKSTVDNNVYKNIARAGLNYKILRIFSLGFVLGLFWAKFGNISYTERYQIFEKNEHKTEITHKRRVKP